MEEIIEKYTDLISRQAAVNLGNNLIIPLEEYLQNNQAINNYVAELMRLPSSQPEIIRCKDCLMHNVCRFEQGLGLNGYCSNAERREDEVD